MNHGAASRGKQAHAALEAAKWAALATMTADHWGKIVEPDHFLATHVVGRLAFPLFAWIVGTRLALSPGLTGRYLRRLLPWALVSQPVFVLAGRSWIEGNILVTLLLGVAATWALRSLAAGRIAAGLAALLPACALAPFAEFGPVGVAAVPITAFLARRGLRRGAWAAGPLGLLANARNTVPPLALPDAAALLATPVALLCLVRPVRLPRLPTHVFYAYYPLHLLALHLIDLHLWPA